MSMKSIFTVFALGILASCLALRPALAATKTASFSVTATVQASCLASANTGALGTYTSVGANATSLVSVACDNATPYNVDLSARLATDATVTTRMMDGPSPAMLGNVLLPDSAHSVAAGRTVGTHALAATSNGSTQRLTVNGQTIAAPYVAPGEHAEAVIVTVTY
jgi:spore coat protein U-like protein